MFRQTPRVPLWAAALPILPVIAIVFLLTQGGGSNPAPPLPRVAVPDVQGSRTLAIAAGRLRRVGLSMGEVHRLRRSGPRPGSVIAQSPGAGTHGRPGHGDRPDARGRACRAARSHDRRADGRSRGREAARCRPAARADHGARLGGHPDRPPGAARGHAGATRKRSGRVADPTADRHDLDLDDVDVDGDRHDHDRDGAGAGRRARGHGPQARRRDQRARQRRAATARAAADQLGGAGRIAHRTGAEGTGEAEARLDRDAARVGGHARHRLRQGRPRVHRGRAHRLARARRGPGQPAGRAAGLEPDRHAHRVPPGRRRSRAHLGRDRRQAGDGASADGVRLRRPAARVLAERQGHRVRAGRQPHRRARPVPRAAREPEGRVVRARREARRQPARLVAERQPHRARRRACGPDHDRAARSSSSSCRASIRRLRTPRPGTRSGS